MSTNYIIGIVIVLLILGGGFFLLQDGTDTLPNDTSGEIVANGEAVDNNDTVKDGEVTEDDNAGEDGDAMDDTSTNDAAEKKEVTVTYTDSGFEPASVTISNGESVTFVNNSGRKVWPASNRHPTHTLYPTKSESDCLGSSFDACRGLESGESWTFTFDQNGSWTYHNHLRANHGGTIVVN